MADLAEGLTLPELLVSTLGQCDALAKLLIGKGVITKADFLEMLGIEREACKKLFRKVGISI
jgi:hypothetical protein